MSARVLVVDDNAIVRDSIRDLLLSEPGWDVCGEAANGTEAIERADSLHPDLIVMDLMMPRVGGLQATREIVKQHPDIRILILTLYDYPSLEKEARAAGARGCMRKGQSGTLLLETLHQLALQDSSQSN
jgi:DNA-binding NarL/FixJ family response regulator